MVLRSQLIMGRGLTEIKDRKPNLNEFWVRALGFSKDFSRIRLLRDLSPVERLFAALIRKDRATARELLDEQILLPKLLDQLIDLIRVEDFASLIFDRIVELELAGQLEIEGTNSASALAEIRSMARSRAISHYQLDQKFAHVLDITEQHRAHSLWIKGAHLSRSVYVPPYFRHFSDLDVIVHPSTIEAFVQSLKTAGFQPSDFPAYCNQLGVGPVKRPLDVITAPFPDWIPSGVITMGNEAGMLIDIKVGPFERGVQAVELERLFADAEEGSCMGKPYLAPCPRDHLMIMLCNFEKNRFQNWRTLFDIHLLSHKLDQTPIMWQRFLQECAIESIITTAWIGLSIAVDRLGTAIPDSVLEELAPRKKFFAPFLTFTVNPAFVWNSTSFPMMLLNACVSADRKRKLHLLSHSFFPSARFLCDYYGNREESTEFAYVRYLLMHWFVLLMPGGLVRRTLGRLWWSSKSGF